jgi:hypothetical protein
LVLVREKPGPDSQRKSKEAGNGMMAMKVIVRDSQDAIHEFDCTAEPFCDVRSLKYDSDEGSLEVTVVRDTNLGRWTDVRKWKDGEWKTLQILA